MKHNTLVRYRATGKIGLTNSIDQTVRFLDGYVVGYTGKEYWEKVANPAEYIVENLLDKCFTTREVNADGRVPYYKGTIVDIVHAKGKKIFVETTAGTDHDVDYRDFLDDAYVELVVKKSPLSK